MTHGLWAGESVPLQTAESASDGLPPLPEAPVSPAAPALASFDRPPPIPPVPVTPLVPPAPLLPLAPPDPVWHVAVSSHDESVGPHATASDATSPLPAAHHAHVCRMRSSYPRSLRNVPRPKLTARRARSAARWSLLYQSAAATRNMSRECLRPAPPPQRTKHSPQSWRRFGYRGYRPAGRIRRCSPRIRRTRSCRAGHRSR